PGGRWRPRSAREGAAVRPYAPQGSGLSSCSADKTLQGSGSPIHDHLYNHNALFVKTTPRLREFGREADTDVRAHGQVSARRPRAKLFQNKDLTWMAHADSGTVAACTVRDA